MKVVELTTWYCPHVGGVEQYVERISQELRSMGCIVEIFTLTKSKQDNVRSLRHLRIPRVPEWIGLLPSPSILDRVLKSSADLVHAHAYGYSLAWVAAAAKKLSKMPFVFTTHSDPHSRIYPIYDFGRAIPIKACDMLIANTRYEAARLCRIGADPSKIRVIPNGLDIGTPGPRPLDEPYILCLGRVVFRQKGQDLLLKAYDGTRLLQKLVFAGDGPDLPKLRSLANGNSNIIFLGPVYGVQKWTWLAHADLVVIPSRTESFGLVALEAAAMRTRVVATRVGGLQYAAGPSSVLAEPNPKSLSEAISRALGKNTPLTHLDLTSRSWKRVAEELLEVFREVVKKRD